ncbi:MAG: hypothetical protein IMZ47_05985 [Firmicutes bacterium]|nr:hypothetical protein [Bacillota bacterium]
MAVKGCIRVETRPTQGDESGIYRITENKQGYLMLAFEEQDEARTVAKIMAKALGVPYKDHLYTEGKMTGAVSGRISGATVHKAEAPIESNTPKRVSSTIDVSIPEGAVRPKPRKVMGALKLCQDLFDSGKSETEVMDALVDKYLVAGHESGSAKKFAAEVLRVVKK